MVFRPVSDLLHCVHGSGLCYRRALLDVYKAPSLCCILLSFRIVALCQLSSQSHCLCYVRLLYSGFSGSLEQPFSSCSIDIIQVPLNISASSHIPTAMAITPLDRTKSLCNKLRVFLSDGLAMLERCLDAVLMFLNRADAFFGWPENPTRRSEQYWRRIDYVDSKCDKTEIVVWGTGIKKLKAPGKRGNLCVFIPPRTPFVQEDLEVDEYKIQRKLNLDLEPASCSPTHQARSDNDLQDGSTTIRKPKPPGKLGMLRITVPATESFIEEAHRANEYYEKERVAHKVLRQAIKRGLPPTTPSELDLLLPPTKSLYLDCSHDDEPLLSKHFSSGARKSRCYSTNLTAYSSAINDAQANDVWLDIYCQEAGRRKVSRSPNESKVNIRSLASKPNFSVVYWADNLSAQPGGFWDQM